MPKCVVSDVNRTRLSQKSTTERKSDVRKALEALDDTLIYHVFVKLSDRQR
jgi:hypothetical protein